MFSTETEDLQMQIYIGKKHNLKLLQDNDALKVKCRKLEAEVSRRNRLIGSFFNGKQSLTSRNASEFSAALLMKLKEENEELKIKIIDQERIIKKLKQDIVASKLYLPPFPKMYSGTIKTARSCASAKPDIGISKSKINTSEPSVRRRCMSDIRSKNKMNEEIPAISLKNVNSDSDKAGNDSEYFSDFDAETEEEIEIKSEFHEEEKQLADKNISEKQVSSVMVQAGNTETTATTNATVETITETKKRESEEEKPHEEIEFLKESFKDMINEVKELKESIYSIQKEQVKTSNVLEQKDSNLVKLATEIKNLTTNTAAQKISDNPADLQNLRPIQMESNPKAHSRNRNTLGGVYGLTPKKKSEHFRRNQYKVISSPKYDASAIHIFENGKRMLGGKTDIDRCISNVLSNF